MVRYFNHYSSLHLAGTWFSLRGCLITVAMAMTLMTGKCQFIACSNISCSNLPNPTVIDSSIYSYDPYEPTYDEDEAFSPQDPDDVENPNAQDPAPGGTEDPDTLIPATNGLGGNVVEINGGAADTNQQQQGKKNAVLGLKAKRIPEHERSTTPYMTKYERARVLGTRALQIRFVHLHLNDFRSISRKPRDLVDRAALCGLENASLLCEEDQCGGDSSGKKS